MNFDIIDKVRAAGIVGAGGAGFPTHVKIESEVKQVLANAASCEPLLKSDPFLMESKTLDVLRGLGLVMKATAACSGFICIKKKHAEAVQILEGALKSGDFQGMQLVKLDDYYPAGDEQMLVYDILQRVVPEGGIPLQVGAVVCNTETLLNIYRAVDRGKPVTERYLTICGEVSRPLVLKVPIGIRVADVIELAEGATVNNFRVLLGGPMMGKAIDDLATPVTKTTSGVIVLPAEHNVITGKSSDPERIRRITKMVCCQCSRCTDLCPRSLLGHSLAPHKIMRQLDAVGARSNGIMTDALICSECGICEKYACPMMISPREVNAQIKQELLKEGTRRDSRKESYTPSFFRDMRKIPTSRLMERLQVRQYDLHPEFSSEPVQVDSVSIPLGQHIGLPARPVVKAGDRIKKGDLVGEIPENVLGARVHASLDGVVVDVDDSVHIKK